jgi:Phage gp6-like head-tail connector protein
VILNLITGPTVEPIDLATAKHHCRVEITDDDALITSLIVSARRACETRAKRSFVSQTFDMILDSFPFGGGYYNRAVRQFYGAFPGASGATWPGFLPTNTGIIEFPHPPLQSVSYVHYYDSSGGLQTLDPSVYDVQLGTPGRLNPAFGKIWPTTLPRIGAVTIRFVAGYGDATTIPEPYKQAILMVVKDLYDYRDLQTDQMHGNVTVNNTISWLLDAEEWGGYG